MTTVVATMVTAIRFARFDVTAWTWRTCWSSTQAVSTAGVPAAVTAILRQRAPRTVSSPVYLAAVAGRRRVSSSSGSSLGTPRAPGAGPASSPGPTSRPRAIRASPVSRCLNTTYWNRWADGSMVPRALPRNAVRSRAGAAAGAAVTTLRISIRALAAASVASARAMTSSRTASPAAPVLPSLRAATL